MKEIVFQASFGDARKEVRLSRPDGMSEEIWFVLVNNYHQGQIWKRGDQWVCYDTDLTFEDIQIIGEIIENHA